MATRSRIGLMLEDGTIKHSYIHYDGYPTGVGRKLVEHYSDVNKIEELLSYGDMSFLQSKIHPEGEHSFDKPEDGVTVFYNRDRGETNVDSVVTTMDEYLSIQYATYIDYHYLFSGNQWFVKNNHGWELVKKHLPHYALTEEEEFNL